MSARIRESRIPSDKDADSLAAEEHARATPPRRARPAQARWFAVAGLLRSNVTTASCDGIPRRRSRHDGDLYR